MSVFILKRVRIAFPNLAKAVPRTKAGTGEPAFSCVFLLAKDHPQIAAINKALDEAAANKWPGKGPAMRKACAAVGKVCLRDGDLKSETDGFEGMWSINAALTPYNTGKHPVIYGPQGKAAGPVDASMVYGGCYVNAAVVFKAYDFEGTKGLRCELGDVQFIADGDAFGAPVPRADDDSFGAVEGAEGADSLCD